MVEDPVEYWYRYEIELMPGRVDNPFDFSSERKVKVRLDRYRVMKTTPSGVRIEYELPDGQYRFISRNWTKQWANPTVEGALKSFLARKGIHLSILRERIEALQTALHVAKNPDQTEFGKLETADKWELKGNIIPI